jgi:hypothetical protein
MTTKQTLKDFIYNMLVPAVDCWFVDQCRNPNASFYLYYKEAAEGENTWCPIISENAPNESWQLVTPERISGMQTKEQVKQNLYNALYSCPFLGVDATSLQV